MKLFVFHTPELTPDQNSADCAIAIDVLRATSTIATALAVGAEAVQVFSDMDKLMSESEAWQPEKRLRAGERGGSKVAGCELGNSPLDCTAELMHDRRLFISTTNGTRALQKVQASETVEGSFALEDTVCAGAIAHSLAKGLGVPLEELAGNDEMIGAVALYQQWQDNLLGLLHHASHGKRLLRLDCQDDLKYCAQTDVLDVLPIQREIGVLVRA
jgi:2-phosphosulfolactate phosphatase